MQRIVPTRASRRWCLWMTATGAGPAAPG